MIAAVRGEVLDIALDHAVIDAAGVGYKVMATPATLATLRRGAEARLITAMIVREDSMTLYGFADADARNLFLTLIGVSGIGPSIALGALAMYDGPTLRQAIGEGDLTALTRIPKVGKKTAELLALTLRDKVGAVTSSAGSAGAGGHTVRAPVVEALVGLGFAVKQAEEATDKVLADDPDANQASALRAALSMLGRK
ncbi:MAG: Holliday junction branch migration protein RuvA [Mycobacterium sp.]